MSFTKIPRTLLNTSVSDSGDATAITIGSDESVDFAKGIVVQGSGTTAGVYLNGTNSDSITQGNFIRYGTNFATQSNAANSSLITYAYNGSTFVNALTVKSDGKVGIGSDSPTEKLTVAGAITATGALQDDRTSTAAIDFSGGTTRIISYGDATQDGAIAFRTATGGSSSTQRMTITSDGKVGIGTQSPASNFHVETNTHANIRVQAGTDSSASLRLRNDAVDWDVNCQTNDNFAIYNHTVGSERFVINSSGHTHICPDVSNVQLFIASRGGSFGGNSSHNVRGSSNLFMLNAGGSGSQFILEVNGANRGTVTSSSASGVFSDRDMKENIQDIEIGKSEILQLKPKRFKYKTYGQLLCKRIIWWTKKAFRTCTFNNKRARSSFIG